MGLRHRRGRGHLARLGHRVGQGLLAEDVFSGGQRGQRDLGVRVARGADVDQIDVVPGDHRPPVRGVFLPAELGGGGRDRVLVAAAHHSHPCRQRQVERAVDGAPRL
jgi:hypothetical protein